MGITAHLILDEKIDLGAICHKVLLPIDYSKNYKEITEEKTEEPAQEPTETLTEEPATESLTQTPEPTPEEREEVVDLETVYEDLAGWIVLNDSGAAMRWNALQDGVPIISSPRMQALDERIRISLDDVVQCVEGWELTDDGDTVILEAEGYTLALLNEDAGFVAMVDGIEIETEPEDFDFVHDGHYIDVDFLTRALNGNWEWDGEEETLMLRIPGKYIADATD